MVEDIERLKRASSGKTGTKYNLNWTEEPEEKHPKWLKLHWEMMQELKASLAKNICFCFQSTWKLGKLFQKLLRSFPWQVSPKNLKPLTESRPFVHCQRVQHALDIFNTAGSYKYHFINTSQNIKRMPSKDGNAIQCLTPNGAFFSMRHKRYITGLVCSNVSFPYFPLACNGIIKK